MNEAIASYKPHEHNFVNEGVVFGWLNNIAKTWKSIQI